MTATVFTEARHPGDFIVSESDDGFISRENATIVASQTIVVGAVLGKVTADGTYAALDTTATDGTQHAAAIAVYPAVTGAAETKNIAVIARLAEVRAADLTWPDGITEGDKAAAVAELAALNIILR